MIDISHIPNSPGIYFFKTKSDKILYIGKAKDLKKRVSQYFATGSVWKTDMVAKAFKVDFLVVSSESEALLLESNLIKKYYPPYNNLLKGDNSYVYLKITNEKFPNIVMTRFRTNDGAIYIGPKPLRRDLKKLLQILRQFLKFRTCNTMQFKKAKICSDYIFGICKGRCEKQSDVLAQKEYKNIISMIVDFFKGKSQTLQKEIMNEINDAVSKQNFEWAAKLRDIYLSINKLIETQTVVLSMDLTGYIFKIKQIGDFYIYCVLNFFEGKLIDVIRYKSGVDEASIEELINGFVKEFGEMKTNEGNSGFSANIKSINKKLWEEIDLLMDGFLDSFVVSMSNQKESVLGELLKTLKLKYIFKNFPAKIEATDISHLSGGRISGSLVVMNEGILDKKYYRRYKIKTVKTLSDDYQSLKELISRRFAVNIKEKHFLNIPDVFILDGGKGQLGILKTLCEENDFFSELFKKIDFVSLGKGKSRKRSGKILGEKEKIYKFDDRFEIIEIELDYDEADRLLIKLRDEAHRFANAYRQKQMSKEFKTR